MPWNPMRLHQRVGRLSRYGQTRPVQVFILRNPDTVEARIWDLLNAKLERIQAALDVAMDEREDISQLVIGMTGASSFETLFAGGQVHGRKGLDDWFDRNAATIGGEDLVDSVRTMLGSVSRFDFAQVGRNLPKVDLPDLERFLTLAMEVNGRRIMRREDGLEVLAPEAWAEADYAIQDRYKGLVFDRSAKLGGKDAPVRLVGVGHALFDRALRDGAEREAYLAHCARLDTPLLIASIADEVTGQGHSIQRIVVGAWQSSDGKMHVLRDWELLQKLNALGRSDLPEPPAIDRETLDALRQKLVCAIEAEANIIAEAMVRPVVRGEILLLPES
jgi:hypothetical protein